jgi:hypothetical protein
MILFNTLFLYCMPSYNLVPGTWTQWSQILCLCLILIPGHGVVVQFILSKPRPLHAPLWQERLLVDSPTPHVLEQVVHCVHCVQVPETRLHECLVLISEASTLSCIIILRVSFCRDIWYSNILVYYLDNILEYYPDN